VLAKTYSPPLISFLLLGVGGIFSFSSPLAGVNEILLLPSPLLGVGGIYFSFLLLSLMWVRDILPHPYPHISRSHV
jgi:hypothetical protein